MTWHNPFLVEIPIRGIWAEGFQRATGKPFGRLRRGETLRNRKRKEASHSLWKFPSAARGPKVSKGRPESPLVASAEAKPCETGKARKHLISCGNSHPQHRGRRFPKGDRKALWSPPQRRNPAKREKQGSIFSLPSISNLLLVGGFVRLRADEVLSPRGKVPKGRRGRPKGACGVAAPGPPVAKKQCTASLAGARPAGFTSVPGRATVAYGAADPSPGSPAPDYPWSDGRGPLWQDHRAAGRVSVPRPCKARACVALDWLLVQG